MRSVRWAGWIALVALVVGSVLGEPRLSFHPPIYLYEFGDPVDQSVQFATIGHMGPGQQFAKVNLKPFPCVRRVRFVRVVVLNAHNAAHVSVRQHAVYIQYSPHEHTRSTYLVWASRAGSQDMRCLNRLSDMMSSHQRRLVQYQLQRQNALHARQSYPLKHGHYPDPVPSPQHDYHQEWNSEDSGDDDVVLGRNEGGILTKEQDAQQEESLSEESSESNKNVVIERSNYELHEGNGNKDNEDKLDSIWKLKRQRKSNVNNTMESTSQVINADVQDIEDPYNITETVEFGVNRTIFRRTSPVRTVKEEIIEEYITPERVLSQSTIPSGMSVIPGFTYQFFEHPSSSEATAAQLPPPPEDLPKDQNEWDAYYNTYIDNNSSIIVTDIPILAATDTNE